MNAMARRSAGGLDTPRGVSRRPARLLPWLPPACCLLLASLLAHCPRALGGEKKAEPSAAERAVAELEKRWAALRQEGTAFALRGRYEALLAEASNAAERHAADPAIARAYWVIARCCEVLGKHPEKEAAFERYVDILVAHSKERAAAELRAEADALIARRQLFPATKLLRLMLSKFPDGPEAAWALYRLGTCHLWMDRFDEATAALAEVVARFPKTPLAIEARLRLARANVAHDTPGESVATLESYLAQGGDLPQRDAALFDLAVARYLSRDYYGALVGFQRLIREAPKSPYVPIARACVAKLRADVLRSIGRVGEE